MAREPARVRVLGIDDVAHLARQRAHRRVVHHRLFVVDEAGIAAQHADGDGVGNTELGGITVGRILLGRERLRQAVHDALGSLAFDRGHIAWLHAFGNELARAIDVRMRHRAASIRLEGDVRGKPKLARAVEHRTELAAVAVGKSMKKALLAVE